LLHLENLFLNSKIYRWRKSLCMHELLAGQIGSVSTCIAYIIRKIVCMPSHVFLHTLQTHAIRM